MSSSVHKHLFTFDPTDERDSDPEAPTPGTLAADLFRNNLTAMEIDKFRADFYALETDTRLSPSEADAKKVTLVRYYESIAKDRQHRGGVGRSHRWDLKQSEITYTPGGQGDIF